MTDEQQALARRAVESKHWRWMVGVLIVSQWAYLKSHARWLERRGGTLLKAFVVPGSARLIQRAQHADCVEWQWSWSCDQGDGGRIPPDALPDFTDPATLGCLLALVREAWGDEGVAATRDAPVSELPTKWWVCLSNDAQTVIGHGPTEAHSLVRALEAAP